MFPNRAESFRTFPNDSEAFGIVRKLSEPLPDSCRILGIVWLFVIHEDFKKGSEPFIHRGNPTHLWDNHTTHENNRGSPQRKEPAIGHGQSRVAGRLYPSPEFHPERL